MTINTLNELSQTPAENVDFKGVGIQGSNKPSNLDDAERAFASMVADWIAGDAPIFDTADFCNEADPTKVAGLDTSDQPTSTNRRLNTEAVYQLLLRGSVPRLVTAYDTAGNHTHTFADSTVKFKLVAVASGGGSGAVDGQNTGTGGSSAGGNSGFFGETAFLARADSLVDGDIVIGAVGAAGAAPSDDGGDGADLTWSDGTNSFTWPGGKGSGGIVSTSAHRFGAPLANDAASAGLTGSYGLGTPGSTNVAADLGGLGGSNPWGTGGIPVSAFNETRAGAAGTGYGAGASGAAASNVTNNAAGAAGTVGRIEVWEY